MTVKVVGIVVDDPSNLWFRYADVSAVRRQQREVHVYLRSEQVIVISAPDEARAAKLMRDIVTALEGQA